MFTDLYGFATKVQVWTVFIANLEEFPSYRTVKIRLANLERLINRFDKEVPTDLLLSVPEKKLRKIRGQYKRRVAQEDKKLERCIRQLIEEAIIHDFGCPVNERLLLKPSFPPPPGGKAKPAQIRGAVQNGVARVNRYILAKSQLALRESYEAARSALGGDSRKS